ncbi:hypothetical protein NXV86_17015 [Bacteroides sp. BFG-257]|uniref:hypothetical protein n=1 Tax=Bacteroides TaxID=816 RepID=UPI001CC9E2A6|nr:MULTISPECIES: hypothetical protein [Bacteroides]UBD67979.1 hypothetical protein K6V21_16250 [Bacteroides cellulosilyticus]UVO96675.1 hypothetical protein NXV86_17015 [Bacteroides sp. BFG-257]
MEGKTNTDLLQESHGKIPSLFAKITMVVLIVYPILQVYALFGINLANCATGFLVLYGLITHQYKIKKTIIPKFLWIYYVYFIVVTILSGIYNISEMPNRVAGVIFSLLQFLMFFGCADIKFFYKAYRTIGIITVMFFFLQESSYHATGYRISGIIPFLPLDPTFAAMDSFGSFQEYLSIVGRSTAFFSEPAHLAQFLLPFLAMSIYFEKGIKRWALGGVTCIALFVLQSGNGVVGLGCIVFAYILSYFTNMNSKLRPVVLVIMICIAVFSYRYLADNESAEYYSERSEEITMGAVDGEVHSGFYRIYRGFFVYAEYNFIEKIFGINNFAEIQNKIKQSSVSFLFKEEDMYFNVIQAFLIKTGMIGLVLYVLTLIGLWKNNTICGRSLLLTFIVFSFMSGLHLTSIMIVYLLVPYFFVKDRIQTSNPILISKS